tara:strand:+ start:1458 stop:2387 length:930 start_codon:yes stop_codon:yes gene_type:complete
MFHHFHDDKTHMTGQGSINKDDFYKIIKFIGRNNILDANVFFEKSKKNKLRDNEVCFTFDDAIKCQIDIALPVLEELKIKSFFFVYTSVFEDKPDNLEFFRYFRMNNFNSVNEFYDNFYKVLDKDLKLFFKNNNQKIKSFKIKNPFYSIEDIKFRFVRDIFLTKVQYEKIMLSMFKEKKFNYKNYSKKIFFQKSDIQSLNNLGHLIGLHSHNHLTLLEKLNYDQQKNEYEKCLSLISSILSKPRNEIKYMSHPCGSYNNDTLEILKDLGVELGFKHNMSIEPEKGMKKVNNSSLEIAREDHANILKRII